MSFLYNLNLIKEEINQYDKNANKNELMTKYINMRLQKSFKAYYSVINEANRKLERSFKNMSKKEEASRKEKTFTVEVFDEQID